MIERLAIWYLKRRGRMVLPYTFIGLVFGNCVAKRERMNEGYDLWTVSAPKDCLFVAMTNSLVDT